MVERKTPAKNSSDEPENPDYMARLIDATAMKAFAHPLRMAMYDYLNDHGSATATMLAKHTGESTGQTSYHLRQLERHGFVAEDPAKGSGRERWWTALGFSVKGTELAQDSGTRPAVEAMLRNQVNQRVAAMQSWYEQAGSEDPRWVNASTESRVTATMTLAETQALKDALMTLVHEHTEAARGRREGTGAPAGPADGTAGDAADPDATGETRRVRVYIDVFPLPGDDV